MFDLQTPAVATSLHFQHDAAVPAAAMPRRVVDSPVDLAAVVIGASSPVMLCGLEALVHATAGMRLVGAAQSLDELVAVCAEAGDAIALVDPALTHDGLHAFMTALKAAAPRLRTVLMTDAHQPHLVREAVRLGASGLVARTADAVEIRAALCATAAGRRYIAPEMASHLAEAMTLEDLTQRESQVLARLSQGDCNKSIARELDVTVGTVKTHVRSIMCKLDARSRTEAVHKAYRLGLLCHAQ